jgi:hypothetical protein
MRAYQLARSLLADSWSDADRLRHHLVTEKVSGQLYAAVGSIAANIAEGYSRSSGRDRSVEPVLGAEIVCARLDTLEEIRRLLLAIIPRERTRLIRPANPSA